MGFFVRTIPLRKRRAKLHKHLIELMQRCASGDPAGVQSAVKKIDPSDKLSGNARELETMVQNFVETAVRMACSSRQLAVLRPLCEASHWTFEVQVGEDRRSFCDRILDVVLVCALSHVNIAGVRLVLSYEDWRPRAHHQFILVACRCNKVDIVQELLGDKRMRGVANQKQWVAGALESARNMRMESLRAIVNAKVLPDNSVGEGAIVMSACAKGQTGLVSELLADPNMPVKTLGLGALHIAASKGHVETMRILLDDARIRPESDGWKALDSAAVGGHLLATVELLERMRKSGSAQAARTRALRAASAWPRSCLAMEAILDAEDHRGGELDTLGLECMARVCGWDLDTPDVSAIQASGLVRRFAESALSQDFVDLLGPDLVLWAIRAEDVELLQLLLAHDAVQLYGRDAEDALSSACASESAAVFTLTLDSGRVPYNSSVIWRAVPEIRNRAILHRILQMEDAKEGTYREEALARACAEGNVLVVRGLLKDARTRVPHFDEETALPNPATDAAPADPASRDAMPGLRIQSLSMVSSLLTRSDIFWSGATISLVNANLADAAKLDVYIFETKLRMRQEACTSASYVLGAALGLTQHSEVAVTIAAMAFGGDIVRTSRGGADGYLRAQQVVSGLLRL